ncbi:hypothetical protein CEXT_498782, partial [Caerostris extrusa]
MTESEPPPPPSLPHPQRRLSLLPLLVSAGGGGGEPRGADGVVPDGGHPPPAHQLEAEVRADEDDFHQVSTGDHRTAAVLAREERREEEARQKIQLLEQRLQGTGDSYKDCVANSDQACKDQIISNLEQQVEEQKKLRILDAKKVEAKASKIKEWVTNKLKELEEQNFQLREENKKCNAQLEVLKKRMSQMSQPKEKNNAEDSSRGSWEDQGSSDDAPPLSSISSANQRANYINNNEPSYSSSMPVVEGNKKSSSWVSAQQARVDQWIDSSCQVSMSRRPESEEADNLQAIGSDAMVEAGLPPMVPPHSATLSTSPFSQTSTSRTSDSKKPVSKKQHSRSLPRETTRNSSMQVTNIPSSTSRTTTTQTNIENDLNSSNKASANNGTSSYGNIYGSLDRKLKMLNVGNGYAGGERRRTVQTSNDLHDYAEIYTPSKEIIGGLDPDVDIRPPTPPLHRFPSW